MGSNKTEIIKEILVKHHNKDTLLYFSILGEANRFLGVITKIKGATFCVGSNIRHYEFLYSDVKQLTIINRENR